MGTPDIGIGSYNTIDPLVLQATIDGLATGTTHYSRLPAANPVVEAVARKYLDEQGVDLDAPRHLMGGARVGMTLALLRLLNPGERVVIPDPDYVGLAHVARGLGAEIARYEALRRGAANGAGQIGKDAWPACGRPESEREAGGFVTGWEPGESLAAARHGEPTHGKSSSKACPQRLTGHSVRQAGPLAVQCPPSEGWRVDRRAGGGHCSCAAMARRSLAARR